MGKQLSGGEAAVWQPLGGEEAIVTQKDIYELDYEIQGNKIIVIEDDNTLILVMNADGDFVINGIKTFTRYNKIDGIV